MVEESSLLAFMTRLKKQYILLCLMLVAGMFMQTRAQETDTLYFNVEKYSKPQGLFSRDYSNDIFKGGDYNKNGLTFTLVLHETNSVPVQLLIVPYQQDSVFVGNNIGCAPVNSVKGFQVEDKVFELVEYNPVNNWVIIQESNDVEVTIVLNEGGLPPLDFVKVKDSAKVDFSHYKEEGKLIYIDFWGLWCPQCLKDMPELKSINTRYNHQLTIIGLNKGDRTEEIRDFVSRESITWIQGYADANLERWFYVEGFPHGVLFDEWGNLMKMNCSVYDLKEILENLSSK